jgi:hypothetical protein
MPEAHSCRKMRGLEVEKIGKTVSSDQMLEGDSIFEGCTSAGWAALP